MRKSSQERFHASAEIVTRTFQHHGTWRRDYTGDNPFKYTKCDKSFSRSMSLMEHEGTHTGERAFYIFDEKSFSKAGQEHGRTHTGEKSFECTKCDNIKSLEKL